MTPLRRALAAAGSASLLAGVLALSSPLPAAAGVAPDLIASTDADTLITLSSTAPGASATEMALTGAPADADLLAVDVRPKNQVLYGLFRLASGFLAVAPIDHLTGAVGTPVDVVDGANQPLTGQFTAVGIDFNPVVDRLRVVSNLDDNLRVDVDTGIATVDAALNGNAGGGDNQCVVGAAYTNSTPGPAAATTQLFDIVDGSCPFAADFLAIQAPPNDGTLTPVGPLGIDSQFEAGFEITAGGTAFLATRVFFQAVPSGERSAAGATPKRAALGGPAPLELYTVSLVTGAATLVGQIGAGFVGDVIDGLTSFPVQVPVVTTTSTTALATTTTAAVRSATTVLARTGDEEEAQGALGVALVAAGATALLFAARMRRRAVR